MCVNSGNETSKREATSFKALLNSLGVTPQRAVFVSDDLELDLHWPNNLVMTIIWVRRPHTLFESPDSPDARPDYVLPHMSLAPGIVSTILDDATSSSSTSE